MPFIHIAKGCLAVCGSVALFIACRYVWKSIPTAQCPLCSTYLTETKKDEDGREYEACLKCGATWPNRENA